MHCLDVQNLGRREKKRHLKIHPLILTICKLILNTFEIQPAYYILGDFGALRLIVEKLYFYASHLQ